MKHLAHIILSGLSSLALGQNARISVHSDSIPFYLSLNELEVTTLPILDITLFEVTTGKVELHAEIFNDSGQIITQQVLIKPNTHSTYELTELKGIMKIVPVAEHEIVHVPQVTGTKINVPDSARNPPQIPEEEFDLPTEFTQLKSEIDAMQFEGKKLERMKSFVKVHPLNSDQLRLLMAQLEMEANKLELFELAHPMVSDKHRLIHADEDFFLEKNKLKVRSIAGI